jgi:hypothetical protein
MNPEVTLRPFDLADLDDFYTWASDDRVSAWCRWDTYTSKEDLLYYMNNGVLPHPWMRAICYGGRPVGAISVISFYLLELLLIYSLLLRILFLVWFKWNWFICSDVNY